MVIYSDFFLSIHTEPWVKKKNTFHLAYHSDSYFAYLIIMKYEAITLFKTETRQLTAGLMDSQLPFQVYIKSPVTTPV